MVTASTRRERERDPTEANNKTRKWRVVEGGERLPKPAGVSMKRTPSLKRILHLLLLLLVWSSRGRRSSWLTDISPCDGKFVVWWNVTNGHSDYETETTLADGASFFLSPVRPNVLTSGLKRQDYMCNISRLASLLWSRSWFLFSRRLFALARASMRALVFG